VLDWLRKKASTAPSAAPGAVTRDLQGDGWRVQLDLTPQRLALEIPEEFTELTDAELVPTCNALRSPYTSRPTMVSLSMMALKAKLFDDCLYAATDLAIQPRKTTLLAGLGQMSSLVAAAARLGGSDVPTSAAVEHITSDFLNDPRKSKPLGFYTWSENLRRIFQQDRLLQEELDPDDVVALTTALDADPIAKRVYQDHLDLVAKLTNPLVDDKPPLFRSGAAYFFPPSRSHEGDLMKRLFRNRPIPDGFSLVDEVVRRVRSGSLTLKPTQESGWYDFQSWALEPLIIPDRMPEGARLTMNDRYRRQLEDVFKAIIALTRETHVKQLEIPQEGAAMGGWRRSNVLVAPEISVEPIRAYYQRRAESYEFVREVLKSRVSLTSIRAMTPSGPSSQSLGEDLEAITSLFRGAAAVVGHELGIEPASGPDTERFREWAQSPDVGGDVRMMVPIFHDIGRDKTKVWAILGWATRSLYVSFVTPPDVRVVKGSPRVKWSPAYSEIAYPVFAEPLVSRLLDRDEFRAHCDRYKTARRILENL
jgi:hypothetical protein